MWKLKFKNWEYWPSYLFYLPNIPYAAYLAIKARNLVFFSATNPAIKHSGNGSESKFSTIELIPEAFKPATIFITKNSSNEFVLKSISVNSITYPLIIKPDIGFRGLLVKKIYSEKELLQYLKLHGNIHLIIQEFIEFENEIAIFYYRLPNSKKGKITSITLKKYLSVKGNGKASLKELILIHPRAQLYKKILFKLLKPDLSTVIKKGECKVLNSIGNHSKGTQFINGNHLISEELETTINELFQQIPGIYYGRLDLKYNSLQELKDLKKFKIIEINGIISEPTHIYDAKNGSYFKALKEIRRHWKLIYKISTINHSVFKIPYDSTSDFIKSLINLNKYILEIKKNTAP